MVATGETHSVRELAAAFAGGRARLGEARGHGQRFLRPAEVDLLVGDPSLAESRLGWHREVDFPGLVAMMVDADLAFVRSQTG